MSDRNDRKDAPQDDEIEIELSDEDIQDAMRHLEGYVDVFADDFRVIYHFAHRHALQRITASVNAQSLMRKDIARLSPDMMLDTAARVIAASPYKGLPVIDDRGAVLGMLTETDFLKHLQVNTFLELLLNMFDDSYALAHRCHETAVREAMTMPAVCVKGDADFRTIFRAFHQHKGRSLPVIDTNGHLQGLLLRKDFLGAAHLERLM